MPPFRRPPVTERQFEDYLRLHALANLLTERTRAHDAATPIGGFEASYARRFMADTARFVSREPGARTLRRLPRTGDLDKAELLAALADAHVALRAFHDSHCRDDDFDELQPG